MILIDTDVIVDLLRGHAQALDWLRGTSNSEVLATSGFSAMESIAGCRNRVDMRRLDDLLAEIDVLWLSVEGCNLAMARYRRDRLQHGAGLIDALIAQTALEHELALFTFNKKHFDRVPGLEVRAPYDR